MPLYKIGNEVVQARQVREELIPDIVNWMVTENEHLFESESEADYSAYEPFMGDWVVRHSEGNFSVCSDGFFDHIYTPIEQAA